MIFLQSQMRRQKDGSAPVEIRHGLHTGQILASAVAVLAWALLSFASIRVVYAKNDQHLASTASSQGTLLLLRHALAPGVGDPPQFRLGDCTTQRNLNEAGRSQSRAIAEALLAIDYIPTRIWTSQWCRTSETAEQIAQTLRDAGHDVKVEELESLNSTFRDRTHANEQNQALRSFIQALSPESGPYLMVAHQVTITDLTRQWANSGHGVWLDLSGNPESEWPVAPADTTQLTVPTFP